MNTRQLLSVGIDIGTTTTQVIFSHLELVNRAAVSQVPRYEFIKREISWQSPVFFTPVDKQGGLKEAELKTLILEQYQAAGIAPESVDSGAIIITGESAKTRNARPAVMTLSQSLGDFVVASAGPHLESVIAGHGAGAQTLSEQRLCRVLNIDIGGGTANYALFDAGKISGTACLNVGGRLLETDSQGRVVYAHKPGQMIVDECFGAGTDARSLTGAQLVQVTRRMAELIVEAAPINTVLALKPEVYNFRYQQMRADGKNLNHLLSNGHIAVLRNVLRQCPQCNYALVDQFTASNDIRASLQQEFPDVNIVQQHRAEADIAVAAASVLARAKFLEIMQELAEQVGRNELPKGGSDAATNCARELLKELGRGALERLVKVHFANYKKI